MEVISLIVDIIARIFVPLFVPVVVFLLGKKPIKKIFETRLDNIEKQLREHIRDYSDEDQKLMEKTINEVFSKPEMRWYR